ncbi:hypothetical protein C8F01DRAFT_622354 [Mycena amicta]|nr:hypothetical protein C8F01DRAFT_622354 [Mycena amicta]
MILAPRTVSLPLRGVSFPFPILLDDSWWPAGTDGDPMRRTPDLFEYEVPNLRTILTAASTTLKYVLLPGELLRVMDGSAWNALTELHLHGFWPLFDDTSESGPSLQDHKPQANSDSTPHPISTSPKPEPTAPSAPTTPPLEPRTTVAPDAPSASPATVLPPNPDIAPPTIVSTAPAVVESISPVSPDASSVFSVPLNSVGAEPSALVPAPPEYRTATESSVPSDAAPSPEPEGTDPLVTALHTKAAVAHTSDTEGTRPESRPLTPTRNPSPILSILEAMPNLRILHLQLSHHTDDDGPLGALICPGDGPPPSPTFLRHLS